MSLRVISMHYFLTYSNFTAFLFGVAKKAKTEELQCTYFGGKIRQIKSPPKLNKNNNILDNFLAFIVSSKLLTLSSKIRFIIESAISLLILSLY